MKTIHVLYHGHCPDGITAAAVFKHMVSNLDVQLDFVNISYGNEEKIINAVTETIDKSEERDNTLEMIFLDYCPAPSSLELLEYYKYIIVDHHNERVLDALLKTSWIVTNALDIGNIPINKHSGAMLTALWLTYVLKSTRVDQLFDMDCLADTVSATGALFSVGNYQSLAETLGTGLEIVEDVSDYDTWTLSRVDSPAMYNGLGVYASTFGWKIEALSKVLFSAKFGRDILFSYYAGFKMQVDEAIQRAYYYPSKHNPILILVNASKSLASEIGRELFIKTPASVVIVYQDNLDKRLVDMSIRTASDSAISANVISKVFYGGGHDNAAGARLAIANTSLLEHVFGDHGYAILENILDQIPTTRTEL